MANSKKSNSTNQINMAIMFLSVALTALLAVLIFVPSSNGGYQATPTPIYLDHNGNPTATPTVAPNATPNAGTNTATPAPTATPTATPTLAPGAVHGKEQGKLYVVQGAVDTQIYIRKIVNGSVSWEDKNLDRLVPGSYFNVVSEESSAYYIMYNGEKWYMDKSWFSSGVSIAAVTEEDAYYHLELTSIFTYSNLNDRKIFTLFGTCDATNSQWNLVTIENQSKGFKVTSKNYTENYSADGLTYTITFKDANNLLAPGQYVVDDEWYWTITVTADGNNKTVTFVSKKPMVYVVAAHGTYKQTIISAYEKPQDNIITVFVDAGHGGIDWGACYTPAGSNVLARESVINLLIAEKVTEMLRNKGYQVYTTRDTDIYQGLYETAYLANAVNADLFVSIHQNVDTSNTSRKGLTTYYQKVLGPDSNGANRDQKPSAAYDLGKQLATYIHNKIIASTGSTNIGVVADNWAVTRETTMPAILIECGFMTNTQELANLINPSYIQKEAEGIVAGIVEYLENTQGQ